MTAFDAAIVLFIFLMVGSIIVGAAILAVALRYEAVDRRRRNGGRHA